jgi:hypothetical protein
LELITKIGAFAGLVAFFGLAVLALLSFTQGRDIRRLREWAGSAPERDSERKESTSAAAAERAEEMRKLEEGRDAERRAADLREQRRERRDAGLPELTRMERLRERFGASADGLGGQPRYLIVLFVVAVLVGGAAAYSVLHGFGDDEGNGGRNARAKSAVANPSEIEVAVLNGTATAGLAADFGDRVEGNGFDLGAVTNSDSAFEESVVMFERGSGREAHRVATALGISRVQLMTSDIVAVSGGAPVAVVIGEDNASSPG